MASTAEASAETASTTRVTAPAATLRERHWGCQRQSCRSQSYSCDVCRYESR
jgi:hypothetical protein